MQYKTIVLELIHDRPQMQEELRRQGNLLQALDHYSLHLKSRHEFWKNSLANLHPESRPLQIASQAGELALEELVASLPPASTTNGDVPPLPHPTAALPPA